MSWSPQQDKAIKAVRAWLADPKAKQVFRLLGFAGSGKTTLARHLVQDVDGVVLFDESYIFREDAAKHLYTGITRAEEQLTVVV